MTCRIPVWLLAVLPATLIGHALAYALTGQSAADGHHGYLVPALEISGAALIGLGCWTIGGALLRTGRVVLGVSDAFFATWANLAIAQALLFALIERVEGYAPTLSGCAVQVLIALIAALALVLFARLLAHCFNIAAAAGHYLERLSLSITPVSLAPVSSAHTLSICAGTRRFQRPPPHR